MSLHFITGNQGKLKEVQSILGDVVALDIDLVEIQSLDAHEIIRAKLEEARKHHKGKLIVEDTSLYFDGLNGLPGPLIKWFMKSIGNDGLMKIVQNLDNNLAEAKTVIGYSNASGEVSFFEGSVSSKPFVFLQNQSIPLSLLL
jgi:non-canonical purine NTP pyrophosphatase (RdgB/HAM1 family)